MKYLLTKGLLYENKFHEKGDILEIQNSEFAERLIQKGTIVQATEDSNAPTETGVNPLPVASESDAQSPIEQTPVEPKQEQMVEPPHPVQVVQPTASQIEEDIASVESSSTLIEIQ